MRLVPRCYRAVSVTKLPTIGRSPRYFDQSIDPKRCGCYRVRDHQPIWVALRDCRLSELMPSHDPHAIYEYE